MMSPSWIHRNWRSTALVVLIAVTETVAFCPPAAFVAQQHRTTSQQLLLLHASSENGQKSSTIFQRVWNRMDTLEACGLMEEYKDTHPPLVARGGGFKKFMIIMALGMAYKWYRARFINKIPFWEKQPQWNMVVTNKEQEEQLRAYTCQNCGATLFIARNREWFFEGGTGLAGLGCYSCGAKGKDNFVMDRDRIVETVGDDDDYWDFERPLDFVSAAERKQILRQTKGDEDAANQLLMNAQNKKASSGGGGEGGPDTPPPMFGLTLEEAEARAKAKKTEAGDDDDAVDATDDAVDATDDAVDATDDAADATDDEVVAEADGKGDSDEESPADESPADESTDDKDPLDLDDF